MSDTKWTKEQQAAIDTRDCNLLVAAAAGAGKTAVLVERIIKRITNEKRPVDIDRLLVVTFTNAAASEMRERIGDAISNALDKNPESRRLQNQLTLLNKASITTIHSFCLEVIKNNFHRIELDPGFRIGDETETALLKLEAVDELFEEWYEKEEGREDFLSLIESYSGSRDDKELQDMVLKLYEFAKSSPWPEKWLKEAAEAFSIEEGFRFSESKWAEVILKNVEIELKGLQSDMERAVAVIKGDEGLEPYIVNFQNELNIIKELVLRCEDGFESLYNGFNNIKFDKLKRCGKDADPDLKKRVTDIRKKVKERLDAIKADAFILSNEKIADEMRSLYPKMRSLSLLALAFDVKFSQKKRDKGIIDFNDIEHFALNILTEEVDGKMEPSEVALEYMDKFDEILIDEYQDSNLVQEVLLSIIAKRDVPNRFMVGDVKQSIYRFRQAKPELFLEKYNIYSQEEGESGRKITLYKNFRSRSEVIEGVNYIFKRLMSLNLGELEYTDRERLNLGADYKDLDDETSFTGGPVEIHLIEKNAEEAEDEESEETEEIGEAVREDEEEEVGSIQLEARMTAIKIKELMREENGKRFKVFDKGIKDFRNLEYRDIVILLRATSRWAPVFLEELTNAGIPAFADTGVGYFETTEIKTIISLLQTIDNPMQDIPLLAVLRSPIFSFSPEELIDIRLEDEEKSCYEALKKLANEDNKIGIKAREVLESIRKWQDKSLHLSTDELLWYLYTETGYYGYVGAMIGGVQRQANLRVLFERAKQYEDTSFKGLFNFINFINKLKVSSGDMGSAKILGENENVVRIMSIHKSKGLEFPVVITSGMGKHFNLQDLTRSILFHHDLGLGPDYVDFKRRIAYPSIIKEAIKKKIKLESLSEEMRILYVAFTRAKEKLIITGTVNDIDKNLEKWDVELENGEKLPEFYVLKSKTYLDWICPIVLKHRDACEFRGLSVDNVIKNHEDGDISSWKLKRWRREEIIKREEEQEQEERDILKELEALDLDKTSSEFSEEIVRRLDFKYPYLRSSTLPAKISVTEVKRLKNLEELDEDTTPVFQNVSLRKPVFLEGKSALTAAERGTIMHLVMQRLDLLKVLTWKEIKQQVEEMVERELLTEEQAKSVNIKRIENFFKTELGERMLKADALRREVPFHIELKSTEIYKDLPEGYGDELIAVQGIIDCFFEESGEIVLLDYKTDYVADGEAEAIKEKYRVQIELYANALQRITGKQVKEKFIYLFHTGEPLKY